MRNPVVTKIKEFNITYSHCLAELMYFSFAVNNYSISKRGCASNHYAVFHTGYVYLNDALVVQVDD